MADTQALIKRAYAAFNKRDIDSVLALMSENVSWPKASEGGRVVGKEEIRSYWTRQWKEFDPHVEPLEVIDQEGGTTHVKVHQLVKSLGGDVLSDGEVWHVYTIANGLLERMDLKESATTSDSAPSTAFAKHASGVTCASNSSHNPRKSFPMSAGNNPKIRSAPRCSRSFLVALPSLSYANVSPASISTMS